jgi:hypothetical protein
MTDKVLIVKGIAGLGNRILALLSAMLYARLARRGLIVDWRDGFYAKKGINAFPLLFECPGAAAIDAPLKYASLSPEKWKARLDASALDLLTEDLDLPDYDDPRLWRDYTIDLSRVDHPEEALVIWSFTDEIDALRTHFTGEYSELKRASSRELLRALYLDNLTLSAGIRERVDTFKKERFAGKIVGVHVRYSDKKTRVTEIRKALDALLDRERGLKLFLATDSARVLNDFEKQYGSVISTQKWYPSTVRSMHDNPECPDLTEAAASALIDMYLLSESDYMVIDASSAFSYVAALITRLPDEKVINVQRGGWLDPATRRRLWLAGLRLKGLAGLR